MEVRLLDDRSLAIPLSRSQVEAANRLHEHLKQWRQSDAALTALAQALPGFDMESTILKVVSINALYGTNVFAILRMAEHVFLVMNGDGRALRDIDLVERLAHLPATSESGVARTHTSFASKFAHFFIDPERFPIYDSYAVKMVGHHLGLAQYGGHRERGYRGFVTEFAMLKCAVDPGLTNRQLDRYLWVAGQYREYLKNPRSPINRELRSLFEAPPPECEPDLAQIALGNLDCGAGRPGGFTGVQRVDRSGAPNRRSSGACTTRA